MSELPPSKDVSSERLADLIASCIFQSETGGHSDQYIAFLGDVAAACMELQRLRTAPEPRPVEAWHGQRKVTIYPDSVMRVWGPNIETDMIDEPRTLASVQAAFGWLYSAQPPGVFSQEQMLTALVHADPIFGPGQTETIRTFIHELPRHIARATATKPDECSHDGFRTCRKCGASLGEPDAR